MIELQARCLSFKRWCLSPAAPIRIVALSARVSPSQGEIEGTDVSAGMENLCVGMLCASAKASSRRARRTQNLQSPAPLGYDPMKGLTHSHAARSRRTTTSLSSTSATTSLKARPPQAG